MGHARQRPKRLAEKSLQIRAALGLSQQEMADRLVMKRLRRNWLFSLRPSLGLFFDFLYRFLAQLSTKRFRILRGLQLKIRIRVECLAKLVIGIKLYSCEFCSCFCFSCSH